MSELEQEWQQSLRERLAELKEKKVLDKEAKKRYDAWVARMNLRHGPYIDKGRCWREANMLLRQYMYGTTNPKQVKEQRDEPLDDDLCRFADCEEDDVVLHHTPDSLWEHVEASRKGLKRMRKRQRDPADDELFIQMWDKLHAGLRFANGFAMEPKEKAPQQFAAEMYEALISNKPKPLPLTMDY